MEYSYLSKTSGIGGTLKNKPEDFVVEEIMTDGTILEINKMIEKSGDGDFTHFVLQKADWSTSAAIKRIAKALKSGHKRFSFAGTKDKVALTTQLVSCFGKSPEEFLNLDLKDIKILGAWRSNEKITLGDLLGNRFSIKVVDSSESVEKVTKIFTELNEKFPNYFGPQRFGSTRQNTHLIGEKLIRNQVEDAAMIFLCDYKGEEHEIAKQARIELKESENFSQALKFFPKHLHLERSMLDTLAKNPNNFASAFRKLPRTILLLFVHAFQSHLFNHFLSQRIAEGNLELEEGEYFCGEDSFGFPDLGKKEKQGWLGGKIIGYETTLNKREKELLEEYKIEKESFKVRSLPEISSKGTYRTLLAPLKGFNFSNCTFTFLLPSGSYATSALREFLDAK